MAFSPELGCTDPVVVSAQDSLWPRSRERAIPRQAGQAPLSRSCELGTLFEVGCGCAAKRCALDAEEAESLRAAYASFLTPGQCADAREEVASVEAAIASLPDAQRDAITMTRLLGLSTAEAAQELGTTESAVRGLIARGLARVASLRAQRR